MAYRYWTDEEIERLKRDYARIPGELLAQEMNRTVSAIFTKAFNLGLVADIPSPLAPNQCAMMKSCHRRIGWRYKGKPMCNICFDRWFERTPDVNLKFLERLDDETFQFHPSVETTVTRTEHRTI